MDEMKLIALMFLAGAFMCFTFAYLLPTSVVGTFFSIVFTLIGIILLLLSWIAAANGIRGG